MRTILRFETPCGQGPCLGNAGGGMWFHNHYARMNCAGTVIPGFGPDYFCAIDPQGAQFWLNDLCLAEAEAAGLVLRILTVTDCLEEDPAATSYFGSSRYALFGTPRDAEGRPREFQVAFRRQDVVSCFTVNPTEYPNVAHC